MSWNPESTTATNAIRQPNALDPVISSLTNEADDINALQRAVQSFSDQTVGSFTLPSGAGSVTLMDQYAYEHFGSTLRIIDIRDPSSMTVIGSVATTVKYTRTQAYCKNVTTSDDYAFVTTERGFEIHRSISAE